VARQIIYDGRTFPDPDPNMSVDEVRQVMSSFFPELANADIKTDKQGEDTVIRMSKRVGTKG
jgi:hypothetical protein